MDDHRLPPRIGRKVMTESCRKTWASAQTPGTQMRIQCCASFILLILSYRIVVHERVIVKL